MQDDNDNKNIGNTDDTSSTLPVGGEVFHPESPDSNTESSITSTPQMPAMSTEDLAKPLPMQESDKKELLGIQPKPPKKKPKIGLILLVIVLLVGLGAAGYWFTKDNKSDNTAQNNAVKETQEIELLRVGSTEGPASVYFPDEGLLGVQTVIDRQIYEGLVGYDDKKIVPLIAKSWTNPDQKTWVFQINPGIKFHTGKDAKAKEIKAALDDLKDITKYEYWSIFVSTIESVEATGDLELTIKTKDPDSLLLNRLSQALISDITAADKSGNNGTGAYQADTTAKNDDKSTTLVPFDDYYGKRAKVRKLVISIFDSEENLIKALNNNEIDIADTIPLPAITKLVEGKDYATNEFDSPGVFGVYMNQKRSTSSLLNNKEYRKAIALAMNRQGLIDELDNKNVPATQVIPKSLSGHDSSISFPAFDLAASKAVLTKEKYDGTPLEVLYIKEVQPDAPVLISQLKDAGFKITEKSYVSDDLSKALAELRAGKFDLFFAGYTSDVFDARDILGSLLGSTESTYPVLKDTTYDKLLTDSDKEFDPVKRIELLKNTNKYILDNLLWIPIRNSNYISYHPKDIEIITDFNGGGSVGAYFRKVGRITP